jgi:hypothetical protein
MALAFCLKKPFLETMSRLPLEEEQSQANDPNSNLL